MDGCFLAITAIANQWCRHGRLLSDIAITMIAKIWSGEVKGKFRKRVASIERAKRRQ